MKKQNKKIKEPRKEILKISQQLFNTKGFEQTSINEIMRNVGMAKGGFYYYFESKDEILDELVNRYIDSKISKVQSIIEDNNHNALVKLKLMFIAEFEHDIQYNQPDNHLHDIKNVDMHQRILVKMVKKYAPVINQVVLQGIEESIFKVEYPLEASEFLVAGFHFLCDLGIFSWNKDEYTRKVKATEEIIEKTLGIEKGSMAFLSSMLTKKELKKEVF
ncbi:MAG: TetR/AcrR family transcriptional regulator [Clostridia bacterium]|nr:TetR/AcrR family transcriptional regulator [Clostridia bacterium]